MIDARRAKRKAVMAFMPVHDVEQDVFLGYLSDLTLEGAMLVSDNPIETSDTVTLSFDLGELADLPDETRVTLTARVVWCQTRGEPAYYGAGIQFVNMADADKLALQRTLSQY